MNDVQEFIRRTTANAAGPVFHGLIVDMNKVVYPADKAGFCYGYQPHMNEGMIVVEEVTRQPFTFKRLRGEDSEWIPENVLTKFMESVSLFIFFTCNLNDNQQLHNSLSLHGIF